MESHSLIPPIGAVSQAERMFRVNWVANLQLTPSGIPFLSADFVAKQGRKVRLIDVREAEELTGVLGHVPGSDWVPLERVGTLPDRVGKDDPVIIVSGGEERSHQATAALAKAGLRFVAFMVGGVMAWRDLGYSTTREASILERRDALRDLDGPSLGPGDHVEVSDVERHVGDALSVKWIKLPALLVRGLVSCVDGRDDSGVIGSPGGDAGEFLVGLRAVERITRRDFSDAEVATLLARRLDAFGRFYMHTDINAANAVIKEFRADHRFDEALASVSDALEWRQFWLAPPRELRGAVLEQALAPKGVGCGHLRLSLTRAGDYETREPLVRAVLSAFHTSRWEGSPEIEFVPLAGGHSERAVLNVRTAGRLQAFSRIPLVSPAVGRAQVFVNHPRVMAYLRRQLASFLAMQTDIVSEGIDNDELHVEMERLAAVQLGKTLGELARGLPIYDVTFHGEGRVEVRAAGHV
jgi:rhodanese-related sulfurtransferase